MKTKTNYHTHTYLCKHAVGDIEDYIIRAIKLNYETIGITDHGPLSEKLQKELASRRMSINEYNEIYLPSLTKAKEKFKGKIEVLSGLEIEYIDELKEKYPIFLKELDYLVLGQHYIKQEEGHYKSVYDRLTEDEMYKYKDTVIEAMRSGYFKIIAHPEIFTWSVDTWNDLCEQLSYEIIEEAIKANVYLEINANGIRNSIQNNKVYYLDGKINFSYPRIEFWKLAKKLDAKVIINDDAHAPNRIYDDATKAVIKMATDLELNIVDKI